MEQIKSVKAKRDAENISKSEMKILWFSLFALCLFWGCKSEHDKPEFSGDQVAVTFKNFKYCVDSPKDSISYTLGKYSFGDTLQGYFYLENGVNYSDFSFNVKNDRFEYLNNCNPLNLCLLYVPILMFSADSFVAIDTIQVSICANYFTVYKYEFANPPIDGGGGCLFCENYGLVGYMSYTWGNRYFLTKWNNIDIENEVRRILQNDPQNRFFLNRNKTLYNIR